jgi:AraC-like DNA-binding protein
LLGAWADAFFPALSKAHPPSVAVRAASPLRAEYDRNWTSAALSNHLATSDGALRRSFRGEFRVSIHDYLRIVRVRAAFQSITAQKVDVVSLKIGYRSRKNFYRALQQFTGLTPTRFRRLSVERAMEVTESLTMRLARRPSARLRPAPDDAASLFDSFSRRIAENDSRSVGPDQPRLP